MIENHPKDAHGNLQMFPGAPAPDQRAHYAATLQHLVRFAELDAAYARWRARQMSMSDPEWFAALPDALDAELGARGVRIPGAYVDPRSKLPALPKGPRGLPKHRFFHDAL